MSALHPNIHIVGITGTLGAGKGTVVHYLTGKRHFSHFSVRAYLLEEIAKRRMVPNRDSMVTIANELRSAHNPSYIIERLMEQARIQGGNCIIESIRTPGEIAALRKHPGFVLLAVDADPAIRYMRIRSRSSETDQISFETFMQNEEREMHSDDPNKQNIAECIRQSDHIIINNGSIEELNENIELFIKCFLD